MVNCIKSGREVKEGQKRYVTNIRGSEKVAGLEKQGSLFLWIGSLTGFERVTILSSTKLSYCSCPMVRML
ncbi:hypothetical protein ACOMHN_025649 [Nucella lapillus]